MSDKFYKKLNRKKPSRSVLDAAYAEMDEAKRAKRHNPRRVFAMVAGAVCSVVIIVIAAIFVFESGILLGGATSAPPNSDKNYSSAPSNKCDYAPSDDNDGSIGNDSAEIQVEFAEGFVSNIDTGDIQYDAYSVNGVDVIIGVGAEPLGEDANRVYSVALGTYVSYVISSDKTECTFTLDGVSHYMVICSVVPDEIETIISALIKK